MRPHVAESRGQAAQNCLNHAASGLYPVFRECGLSSFQGVAEHVRSNVRELEGGIVEWGR